MAYKGYTAYEVKLAEAVERFDSSSSDGDFITVEDEPVAKDCFSRFIRFTSHHRIAVNIFLVVAYVLCGAVFVMFCLDWWLSTALYEIMQIVTTVGYGDITIGSTLNPSSNGQGLRHWQLFVGLYAFFGIAIVANIFQEITDAIFTTQQDLFRARLRELEAKLSDDVPDAEAAKVRYGGINGVLTAGLAFAVLVLLWAGFFSTYERCTCSAGFTEIENCTRAMQLKNNGKYDYDICVESGGRAMDFFNGVYMAVITFSTIGFGDITPMTRLGRVVAVPGMLVGVASFAVFVGCLSAYFHELKTPAKSLKCKTSYFDRIDQDDNGYLSRNEFRLFYLLKEGRIDIDAITDIDRLFDLLDTNQSGNLTRGEVREALDRLH